MRSVRDCKMLCNGQRYEMSEGIDVARAQQGDRWRCLRFRPFLPLPHRSEPDRPASVLDVRWVDVVRLTCHVLRRPHLVHKHNALDLG